MFGSIQLKDGKFHTLETNVDGETFTTFDEDPCYAINILNISEVDIEIQLNGQGETIPIKAGESYFVIALTYSSQVGVLAGSQVTIKAHSFTI